MSKDKANELNTLLKQVYANLKISEMNSPITMPVHTSTQPVPTKNRINPTAILVLACNRPQAIEEHLTQLINKRAAYGSVEKFPIIVSQDCAHPDTAKSIEKFSKSLNASIQVSVFKLNIAL